MTELRRSISPVSRGGAAAELAVLAPRGDLAAEVAGQLGFPSLESLLLRLGDERALLVLDNCEHVLAAAAQLCERLLGAAPALHVLATSRAPLGVDGEELLLLGPLALPSGSDPAELESAATRSSARAARAAPAASRPRRSAPPSPSCVGASTACRWRSSGRRPRALPHRRRAAGPARSPFRPAAARDAGGPLPPPQPACRDRRLLRAPRCAAPGLLPCARRVRRPLRRRARPRRRRACGLRPPRGSSRALAPRRSLAGRAEPQGSVTRYRLLDSLRHYAAEQARAEGEWEGAVERFVAAMLAQADAIVAAGTRRWTGETLERVFAQLGNLAAAIDHCIARDRDASRAFRMTLPLWAAIHQGRASEVADVCERVLARWPEGEEPLRAEVLAVAASASLPAGRVARGGACRGGAARALRSASLR